MFRLLSASYHLRKFSNLCSYLSNPRQNNNFLVPKRFYSEKFGLNTFVSSYHEISNSEIKEFLQRIGLEYKETGSGFTTRYCPLCPKPHYEERTNLYTLGFKANSGVFHCFRCGVSGS